MGIQSASISRKRSTTLDFPTVPRTLKTTLKMAGDQQQFCLRWNDFQTNMVSSFKHLRDEKSFTDVTLACDGQTCKAHKMVLSARSPEDSRATQSQRSGGSATDHQAGIDNQTGLYSFHLSPHRCRYYYSSKHTHTQPVRDWRKTFA